MKRIDLNAGVKMRIHNMPALWKSVHVFELGCALALVAGSEPATCRAEEATTNAVALTMHSIIVPEIHILPKQEAGLQDPSGSITGVVCAVQSAVSNQNSFAIHARNLTMLELVDLICFLSDTTYAFGGHGLAIDPTNMPTVHLQQSAKREKALVAKLKVIVIPEVELRPPATIIDAIDFLYQASADYDDPATPVERRGVNFAVKNPNQLTLKRGQEDGLPRISSNKSSKGDQPNISALSAKFCTLYDTLTNVCAEVDARFMIRDNTVVIYPAGDGTGGRGLPEGTTGQ